MPEIVAIVAAYIDQHRLLPPEGEVIVAVSGGADSLCLLHLLLRLCGSGHRYPAVRLRAAHLNHRLRGEASEQDASAVAALVRAWHVPIEIGEVDVPALARAEHRSLEDAARQARYRFLREVAQGEPIAVAHHADDQVETLLLHWLRGSGLSGMVGMLPRQQDVIRPLLSVTHEQTLAYCREHSIVPIEDASNKSLAYTRNRIRHQLLPLLESLNPGFRGTLLRSVEVLSADLDFIESQVETALPGVIVSEQEDTVTLRIPALLALPLSLQRHVLRRVTAQLTSGQSPLELRHYALIEDLLHRPDDRQARTLHLPHRLRATRVLHELTITCWHEKSAFAVSEDAMNRAPTDIGEEVILPVSGEVIVTDIDEEVMLPVPGEAVVPGGKWLAKAELVEGNELERVRRALRREDWQAVWQYLPGSRYVVYIDAAGIGEGLLVRARRPGDRMQPLGMAHEKKVQDILVDAHIPQAERASIPLFFSRSAPPFCVWLAGVCLDSRARLTGTTEYIARLTLEPL